MEPERWQKIERLYYLARELEQGEREAFLQQECAGDESLRREVESLLACRPKAGNFIESPAIEMAAQALAKDQARLPSRDLIGRTIAHYRVIEKIGEGGMGEVFLADDTSLHRKVALKFLPPEMQQDAAAHKRFIREAHSAAALDHPTFAASMKLLNPRARTSSSWSMSTARRSETGWRRGRCR